MSPRFPARRRLKEGETFTELQIRTQDVERLVVAGASDFFTTQIVVPFAVIAVGGFGRRELFPFSDVDLVLLFGDEPNSAALKEPLGEFLRFLWDSSVKASQSVRTVSECCRLNEQNIELHISLLEARYVYGSAELFASLSERLSEFYRRNSGRISQRLAEMARVRHAKFENTVYHLEPNIKEGPGGVRDIHFLQWASLLIPDKEPLIQAANEIQLARDFLYDIRYFMHLESGRDNNLLSFDLQDKAADSLRPQPVAPEEWMRTYYRHARTAFQSSVRSLEFLNLHDSGLARQFMDWRGRLSTADFTVSHNRVLLRNPGQILGSIRSAFSLFTFVARQGIPLSWDAQQRVLAQVRTLAEKDESATWATWRELLREPHAALALREMQDSGLLDVVFPAWRAIESLVVRDFYHRYTVDEHTLVSLQAIDDLLANKPGTLSRFRELALEDDDLPLLRVALLLHDTGKGTAPGDHVRGSLETADRLLAELNVPDGEQRQIKFLIKHHLDLSLVMHGRDLDDPATARFLTARVPTAEDLRRLTLLTYADISAVNPTAMTPWRSEQLWRVYSAAADQLTRELVSERIHYLARAPIAPLARPEIAHFLEGFPTRYLRIHTRDQIERHFELEQIRAQNGVAVDLQHEPGAYLMTALAADRPGIFASLCGALASFGMSILKAEASSNASGCVLDEFRFADPTRTLELNPDELPRLQWTAECAIKGAIDVRDLLKRRPPNLRPRSSRRVAPSLRFDNAASDHSTLIYFVAEDRPGLLFDLASGLSEAECNIELVLVNTEAHQAIDVFYVTQDGGKLAATAQDSLRAKLLSVAGATM